MSEIMNFFKDILNMDTCEGTPVGLCSFEHEQNSAKEKKSVKKTPAKREMRLSEIME